MASLSIYSSEYLICGAAHGKSSLFPLCLATQLSQLHPQPTRPLLSFPPCENRDRLLLLLLLSGTAALPAVKAQNSSRAESCCAGYCSSLKELRKPELDCHKHSSTACACSSGDTRSSPWQKWRKRLQRSSTIRRTTYCPADLECPAKCTRHSVSDRSPGVPRAVLLCLDGAEAVVLAMGRSHK